METTTKQSKDQLPGTTIDLNEAYILKGNTLEVQTTTSPFKGDENLVIPIEKKFQSKKQFQGIVFENGKILFGAHSLLIETKVKNIEFKGRYIPEAILFDFSEEGKPKCYCIETMLAKQDFFGFLFPRMTGFFAQRNNAGMQASFIEVMCKTVSKNYHFKKKLKACIAEEDVLEFVSRMLANKPPVLLITDTSILELPEMMQVYTDTWGKFIKPMVLRKFSVNRESFCSLSPAFADIDKGKDKVKVKVVKSSEEDHLKEVSDGVRESYNMLKTELLKADKGVEFNPKQYYISIRKNRNLAFAHIGKKRISLVVVNPEKETRKEIKHHEVKTLTEKVQQFWNGQSCTIVIENTVHLNEVIKLLKKLVAKSSK